jgi:polyhydroxybutyrate depolymerase
VKQLTSSYCIDMKRIFATGHSSGGYFTNVVGCARGDVIRAIAPQSGGGPMGGNTCKGPLAAVILHGDSDPSVKPEEGAKSRDYWAKASGCDTTTGTPSTLNPVCFDYSGCQSGTPVVYCPYQGDHNLWTEAPQVIFDFFKGL